MRWRPTRSLGAGTTALVLAVTLPCAHCAVAETPSAHGESASGGDASTAGDPGTSGGGTTDDPGADGRSSAEPTLGTDAASSASGAGSAGPCSALPLCDGFESDAVGGPPSASLWSIAQPDCTGSGTLAVDDSQAHSGAHSVRVNGGGGYCDHIFIDNMAVMPTLAPEVYARFFIRLATPLGDGHVSFLAMNDAADKGGDVRMGGQDAILMYNRQSDDATLPTLSPTGVGLSVAIAANTWTCVELHFDETAGTIDTWVNGAEVAGLVENGTPVADVSTQWLAEAGWKPALTDFRLGWESYSGQTMTLWFDDVALASQRIGCGN